MKKSKEGQIRNIFTANGLWHPNLEKESSSMFTVSSKHYLLSVASMLGPSPDWISGASKLNLCTNECTWKDEIIQDLYPYDVGTDSGLTYSAPNSPTIPQEKIYPITSSFPNNPRATFFDPAGKPIPPLARLIIKQVSIHGTQCPNGLNRVQEDVDFDPADLSDPIKRDKMLNTFSGKKKSSKQVKVVEVIDPNCMTTDWSEWTQCSKTCGNGYTQRTRQYKNAKLAKNCNELLVDSQVCYLSDCDNFKSNVDTKDVCFMVTKWSQWSPCSKSCGLGSTSRMRSYIYPELSEHCKTQLFEKKSCKNSECKSKETLTVADKKSLLFFLMNKINSFLMF